MWGGGILFLIVQELKKDLAKKKKSQETLDKLTGEQIAKTCSHNLRF